MPVLSSVKVAKSNLLEILELNRSSHFKDVADLENARRINIAECFEKQLKLIAEDEDYQPVQQFNFPKVQNHSDDYDTAISMLKMTTDSIITLTGVQYEQLVMDKWVWKVDIDSNKSFYNTNE
jgi:hypothetical protein